MRVRTKPVAAAVYLALLALGNPAHAQTAQTAQEKAEAERKAAARSDPPTETIEVVGIRASLEKSIAVKKEAATNVEVVTAEDVGKMPDKNIADALSRLTGVNVQYGLEPEPEPRHRQRAFAQLRRLARGRPERGERA